MESDKSPSELLTPGSIAAVGRGCTCPVPDNRNGRGWEDDKGKAVFYLADNCPMHRPKNKDKD